MATQVPSSTRAKLREEIKELTSSWVQSIVSLIPAIFVPFFGFLRSAFMFFTMSLVGYFPREKVPLAMKIGLGLVVGYCIPAALGALFGETHLLEYYVYLPRLKWFIIIIFPAILAMFSDTAWEASTAYVISALIYLTSTLLEPPSGYQSGLVIAVFSGLTIIYLVQLVTIVIMRKVIMPMIKGRGWL